jgi:hypothetical protein
MTLYQCPKCSRARVWLPQEVVRYRDVSRGEAVALRLQGVRLKEVYCLRCIDKKDISSLWRARVIWTSIKDCSYDEGDLAHGRAESFTTWASSKEGK